ncbi:MAG: PD-(D/E)XK nuclease-like domain-containing protein [Gammaproteobacteria bacterium]
MELQPFNQTQESKTYGYDNDRPAQKTTSESNGNKQQAQSPAINQSVSKKIYTAGMHCGISNTDYHSSSGLSSSTLKIALESMYKYKLSIDGDLPFKQTPTMALGTAVHAYTLEPENFHNEIAIRPELSYSKTDKRLAAEFEAANQGKVLITKSQAIDARAMSDNILRHPEVAQIMRNSVCEQSGFYTDKHTGMSCKYRPDIRNKHFIADIKSTVSIKPNKFAADINKFGYHVSAAHYLEGDKTLHGTNHEQFIFIAVENKYPFEVAVYTLGAKSLERGYELRARGLNSIQLAKETGHYPMINGGMAQNIEIPNWGFYD